MSNASRAISLLVVLTAPSLAACHSGTSTDGADAATTDDGAVDEASTGDDAAPSTVTIESPADAAPPGDGATLPAACADYDGGIPPYASAAGGTVAGAGISATVCTATDLYVSSYLAPSNRLLLQIAGPVSTDFQSPTGATEGALALTVSVGTDTPALYTSAEGQSCGFAAFTYTLPSGTVTYVANATSDCSDPTNPAGSWAVTLTSVTPYQTDAASPGAHYVAHGMFAATLVAENSGAGTVAVSMGF
jgi:hypothetical protein